MLLLSTLLVLSEPWLMGPCSQSYWVFARLVQMHCTEMLKPFKLWFSLTGILATLTPEIYLSLTFTVSLCTDMHLVFYV